MWKAGFLGNSWETKENDSSLLSLIFNSPMTVVLPESASFIKTIPVLGLSLLPTV